MLFGFGQDRIERDYLVVGLVVVENHFEHPRIVRDGNPYIFTIVELWKSAMQEKAAIAALGALAQETRLKAFRLLVEAGPDGLPAGLIAEALGVPGPTLSFHLAQLTHAGLILQRRDSRSLIYSANFPAMNTLVAYLTENCCGGTADCGPVCVPPVAEKGAPRHDAVSRSRLR